MQAVLFPVDTIKLKAGPSSESVARACGRVPCQVQTASATNAQGCHATLASSTYIAGCRVLEGFLATLISFLRKAPWPVAPVALVQSKFAEIGLLRLAFRQVARCSAWSAMIDVLSVAARASTAGLEQRSSRNQFTA